ncbi:hypothetical protein BZG36_03124 [Bifiguratus adelaidae]|uniref:Glycosyl hydrolase family 32 N-terminal domain-containing protein n=1 Tax=Bifiguratus adelaidae TaxID=1938954 RepID=A0A261Y0Q4_9FUNG|nr:hypothetical protein BZG36_03124 [Bifiguratus adelaidae]
MSPIAVGKGNEVLRKLVSHPSHKAPVQKRQSVDKCITQCTTQEPSREFRSRWPDFYEHRPHYHFMAPEGWMNDPCAPCYDRKTGLYHIFYQWNPKYHEWGNMSRGHAVSDDLITWTHVSYSPIQYLLPYKRGSETLSLASSEDGGKTWTKAEANPILPGPPTDIEPTAWRDPFVNAWVALDALLDRKIGQYTYGIIAGGIRHKTPTCFLYSIPNGKPAEWTYLGPLIDVGLNCAKNRWSGDLGVSWEVCNFFSIENTEYIIANVEGGKSLDGALSSDPSEPTTRQALWMTCTLALHQNGQPQATPGISGQLDQGCLYAVNTFFDPVKSRRILWGWIPEDDLSSAYRAREGWACCLALPRELYNFQMEHVVRALRSDLSELHNCQFEQLTDDTFTLQTLGIRPLEEVTGLRNAAKTYIIPDFSIKSSNATKKCQETVTTSWLSSIMMKTVIEFSTLQERLTVDRRDSVIDTDVNTSSVSSPLTLFYVKDPVTGETRLEPLQIRLFFDNSVLEVYANDRFALSTRIYATGESSVISVSATAKAHMREHQDPVIALFVDTTIWDLLQPPRTM